MFPALKTEIETRFVSIEQFWKATRKLEEHQAVVAKGLLFVQTYAVYEYTVNNAVIGAVEAIKNHKHMMKDLLPSLMAIYLDPELKSLRDGSRSKEWLNRVKMFERAFSSKRPDLSSNIKPPTDGTHYKYSHLRFIFSVFGIRRMPVRRRRHRNRIDEVVAHRNAIAHGREPPENIGRRYTRSEISSAIRQMRSVCMSLVNILDDHCSIPSRSRR